MNKLISSLLFFVAASLVTGCAAPGNAEGNLSIKGSLLSSNDTPLADTEIEFILPGASGLGSLLDLLISKPENFSHNDQSFTVITNQNGEFEQDLGLQFFLRTCWLLPPLGCFPKAPLGPLLLAKLKNNESEYYAIQTYDGKFSVYSLSGLEIPISESKLSNIETTEQNASHKTFWGLSSGDTVVFIKFKMASP